MMYNKANLVINEIASKDENRLALSGVLFKRDRSVATDSYILIEVKNPPEMLAQAKDFPQLPDKTRPLDNFAKSGYIVPAKRVKKVLGNLGAENKNLPVLNNCIFLQPKDEATSVIATTDLERADIVNTRNIQEQYPDYQQIIPIAGTKKIASFDIKVLKLLVDTIAKMNLPLNGKVDIFYAGEDKPLKITAKTLEGQEVTAVAMPLKS